VSGSCSALCAGPASNEMIVGGIDAHQWMPSKRSANLGIGSGENSNRSNVSVRFALKYQNFGSGNGNDDLAMNLIKGHLVVPVVIRALYLSMRSLNDPKRRFFSVRSAAEH